jgi:hypothetical protein
MSFLRYRDKQDISNIVLDSVQKNRQVIYGQQSVNAQLPDRLKRETKDYDILTKKPKQSAERLVEKLNREFGADEFKVEPARYKKTFKVKDKEGNTVADYTSTTKKPKVKQILGVSYADINYQEKKLKRIIKEEKSSFRHDKDLDTLKRIKEGNKKW